MKLRHIVLFFIAALSLAAGCGPETDHYLDGVKVSSSYVALDVDGKKPVQITVDAVAAWNIVDVPAWLTVSPASGAAGSSTVTFSAPATLDGRTAEIHLNCNGMTQNINVIQGLSTVSTATCAEVIAGPESKTYRVTGVCTRITSTVYGNWYINDGTGQVYIYGTLCNGQEKQFLSLNPSIEVGDEVTVEGPKKIFNGEVELVNVTVINVKKSLIKVDSLTSGGKTFDMLPIEGGEFEANLTCKGEAVNINIPDEAKSWLSVTGVNFSNGTACVKFLAAKNEGGDRQVTVEFTTYKEEKLYTCESVISQKGSIFDVNVAQFNEAPVGSAQYRVSAMISSIKSITKGQFYIKDYSGETYVYNMPGFASLALKEGDIVTLTGKRDQYQTTIEMVEAVLEKSISVNEVSIADYMTKEKSPDVWYRLTGEIVRMANSPYGNLYIADEFGNEVYVFGCYPGYGATGDARKNFLATANIEVGDILTIQGYKDVYNGEVELCGGCYVNHVKKGTSLPEYKKVSVITSGKSYLMVAEGMAAGLIDGKSYGYLAGLSVKDEGGVIAGNYSANEIVIASTEGGYTMSMNGMLIYMTGSYNSFNWKAGATDGIVWSFAPQSDGSFKVTNAAVNKWIQFDTEYKNYGAYNTDKGVLPVFYEKQ